MVVREHPTSADDRPKPERRPISIDGSVLRNVFMAGSMPAACREAPADCRQPAEQICSAAEQSCRAAEQSCRAGEESCRAAGPSCHFVNIVKSCNKNTLQIIPYAHGNRVLVRGGVRARAGRRGESSLDETARMRGVKARSLGRGPALEGRCRRSGLAR